jgi:hypothetical protein
MSHIIVREADEGHKQGKWMFNHRFVSPTLVPLKAGTSHSNDLTIASGARHSCH